MVVVISHPFVKKTNTCTKKNGTHSDNMASLSVSEQTTFKSHKTQTQPPASHPPPTAQQNFQEACLPPTFLKMYVRH